MDRSGCGSVACDLKLRRMLDIAGDIFPRPWMAWCRQAFNVFFASWAASHAVCTRLFDRGFGKGRFTVDPCYDVLAFFPTSGKYLFVVKSTPFMNRIVISRIAFSIQFFRYFIMNWLLDSKLSNNRRFLIFFIYV